MIDLGLECRNVDTSVLYILFTLNIGLMHLSPFTDGSGSSFATIKIKEN